MYVLKELSGECFYNPHQALIHASTHTHTHSSLSIYMHVRSEHLSCLSQITVEGLISIALTMSSVK